jgi:hypothetical protein
MGDVNNRLPSTYLRSNVVVPPGTYFYKEVRRLPSKIINPNSLYPGFPIFHLYKQVRDTETSTIEVRVDNYEYWQPLQTASHIIYETNDENQLTTLRDISVSFKKLDSRKKLYSGDWEPFTHRYIAGKIFIATNRFADVFGDNLEKNPYTYRLIRLWILHPDYENYDFIDEDGERRISYFYIHPLWNFNGINGFTLMMYSLKKNLTYSLTGLQESNDVVDQLIPASDVTNAVVTSKNVRESIIANLTLYAKKELGKSDAEAVKYANSIIKEYRDYSAEGGIRGPYENGLERKTVNVIRSTFGGRSGYSAPSISRTSTTNPQIVQQYRLPDSANAITNRHIFQFKPNQINYSGIGSEWTEIPRSGNVPIVDWKSYKLLQVSFQFLVAPDEDGSLDNARDEKRITKSIDDKLRILRRMATAPYPVYLLGFDEILSEQMRFPFDGGRGVEFVIAEFSISSMMRTDEGKINRAQCDITLREIPIESVRIIDFPSIRFGNDNQCVGPNCVNEDDGEGRNNKWTDTRKTKKLGGR